MQQTEKTAVRSILWFRKGLRLHDNPALLAALKDAEQIYPTFIIDPHFVKPDKVGVRRYNFLLESLHDLDRSLRGLGSRLIVLKGNPVEVLPRAFTEWKITRLAFERDTEPYAILRDDKIIAISKEHKIEVHCPVSHTLYDIDKLKQKYNNGKSVPLTYSAFCGLIERMGKPEKPLPPPEKDDFPTLQLLDYEKEVSDFSEGKGKEKEKEKEDDGEQGSEEGRLKIYGVPTLEDLGYPPIPSDKPTPWKGGETEALNRMKDYLKDKSKVAKFEKPKGNPCSLKPVTTVLSPYLKFGCLSVRKFYYALMEVYDSVKGHTKPPVSLLGQVYWREFFYAVGSTTPNFDKMHGNKICRQIPWSYDQKLLKAWKDGQTGYPWIDAVMMQLRDQGWMHHLARHAVACFLTRGDLFVSWELGRDVFDELLLDADWSLNNANWMWLSASAFFNAYFRVYSPITFAKKYDKEGKYIRHFLPVLKQMPTEYIYEPWTAPLSVQKQAKCIIGVDYPKPIVAHDTAMKANMAKMKRAYAKRGGEDDDEQEEENEEEQEKKGGRKPAKRSDEACEQEVDEAEDKEDEEGEAPSEVAKRGAKRRREIKEEEEKGEEEKKEKKKPPLKRRK